MAANPPVREGPRPRRAPPLMPPFCLCGRRFATAGLANDADGLALGDTERDPVDSLYLVAGQAPEAAFGRKMLLQVAHDQQRLCRAAAIVGRKGHVHDGSLMSIALRNPSLSRLKHSEGRTIASPGKAATIGLTKIAWRKALSISPHSGFGGVTPRPRNESPADRMMLMP